jgi:CheY-like chemotaxis protein
MPRILFVEDDPFIAEIYKKKFESSGFDVLNVANGKAVLKEAKEQKFDLILLDLVIPEMSGTEVLRELRHDPEYDPELKIVVFSNLSSQEDRDQCLKLGANGFISKTEFSPSEVIGEINRFLRQFEEREKNLVRDGQDEQAAEEVRRKGKGAGKRVLFIEDEPVFVEMFGKRLRDEGYEVTAMRDGVSGLQAALDGTFDLIICDIMMPGMDGRELVTKLRDAEKENNTPVFVFSASLDTAELRALEASHDVEKTFLKTQITPSELTYAINDFFKEREERVA